MGNCEQKALKKLEEEEPNGEPAIRRAVAREMCRLLDSGILEKDVDDQTVDIEYLISRLEIREGEDNPSLKEKWNSWVGQMGYLFSGDYDRFQV